jgi:hypothetical protein
MDEPDLGCPSQPTGNLRSHHRRLARIKCAVARYGRLEAHPINVLHHQVRWVVVDIGAKDMDNVRVVDRCGCPSLPEEPATSLRVRSKLGREDLYGDSRWLTRALGQEHLAHPTLPVPRSESARLPTDRL